MPRRARLLLPVVLVALSACAGSPADPTADRPPADSARIDPGVVHVHGLGVDPADGALYAATHSGLFALPQQGRAVRVAGRMQDTMGFTITGPDTFLGSGHPDSVMDPHLPPRLGLIRSTDAAQTWETVSLSGEVDFHVLHARHGRIYGWDAGSGALLVSDDDGQSWERRSTVALRDFVVDPQDGQGLLATSEQGLLRSGDGGRTFTAGTGPALVVLTWPAPGDLYGVDVEGAVHHSADGGRSWTQRGALGGEPEALTAHAGDVYAAVREQGVLTSSDGARTWTVRYSES